MSKIKTVESQWENLDYLEQATRQKVREELLGWEPIVRSVIEAGCLAPMVPATNHNDLRFSAAAPFLKRALNDLRSIWILLEHGYSSQSASIAASLYENALTAAVLVSSEKLTSEARKNKYAEIPWTPKQLAQLDARRALAVQVKNGKNPTEKEYQDNWTISYYHYKWLCQIKHPTWQSVYHDVRSTLVSPTEFAVCPGPNNVPEDLHMKHAIMGGSVSKVLEAAKAFFLELQSDECSAEYQAFEDKANTVHFGVLDMMKPLADKKPPVIIIDHSFIKTDFATLRKYDV